MICVLRVKYHKCYKADNGKKNYFLVKAECKHSDCTAYKFFVNTPIIHPFTNCYATVFRSKEIDHSKPECHRRFYSGSKRTALRKELETSRPCVVELRKLDLVPEKILKAGNLNDAPSQQLLQKMSSENNIGELDKDLVQAIQQLAKEYKTKFPGKICRGYIQEFSVVPFKIILFAESVLRYLLTMKRGTVICHLDATGTVVGRPNNTDHKDDKDK